MIILQQGPVGYGQPGGVGDQPQLNQERTKPSSLQGLGNDDEEEDDDEGDDQSDSSDDDDDDDDNHGPAVEG
jgi:hypothetical protein